jgi:hypothetical protein
LFFVTSSGSGVPKIFSKFPTGNKNADSDGDSEPFRHPVVFVLGKKMFLILGISSSRYPKKLATYLVVFEKSGLDF